jgi:serine/threonine protein kinase
MIPILESFTCPCGLGKLITMEQEDLVLSNAPADLFESAGHSLARQFLEGVRFLHRHLVAHLDLKPDNIVVSARTRLRIIDFSVAVRVPRLESRIKGYQGTKGWVAPEVERNPGCRVSSDSCRSLGNGENDAILR